MARLIALCFMLTMGCAAAQATECNDGSYSGSTGSGTCSHHGGERK